MRHLEDQRNIINSKAFRRLADKTQVIFSIERDAQVRSRLTHSLEVASIAKEIALNIKHIHKYEIDQEVVFNTALLHDYGMAPLGHLGESTLQDVFYEKTNLFFEANANNLVVIEKNLKNISILTIVSTIKYPFMFKSENVEKNKKQKGIYEKQYNKYIPILNKIIEQQNQYPEIKRIRTYECDIMELADDIAYLLSDLADAISSYKIKISEEELLQYFKEEELVNPELFLKILKIINEENLELLENIRETIIQNIYFSSKDNKFDFKNKEIVKLQNIIRKIDWDFYIQKYSLLKDNPIILKYKLYLEEIIDLVSINPQYVEDNAIISREYKKIFNDAIKNNNMVKAYKILLISMAEWTDTMVNKKIQEHNYKKII